YEEPEFKLPLFMKDWTDEKKADFAYGLLTCITSSSRSKVADRLYNLIHRDYISALPFEIKLDILCYLDLSSLFRLSLVSKEWHKVIEDQTIWKERFLQSGWGLNNTALETYLSKRTVEKSMSSSHLSPPLPRLGPFKISSNTHPTNHRFAFSRSQPLSIHHRESGGTQFGNRPRRRSRLDETACYHYQNITDTRFINWKRLFRNRSIIERRWQTADYKLHQIGSDPTGIYCLQFDSDLLVTGGRDRQIKVWDIQSGELRRTLQGHMGSVICLHFDHRFLITGGGDAVLIVWDRQTFTRIKVLRAHEDGVFNVKFKGDVMVSSSKDRTIRVWRLHPDGNATTRLVLRGHRASVNAVQFKGNRVVSASGDKTIKIWDMTTGECLKTLNSHSEGIACVEYDGKHIISGSCDQTIKIWNASTGECIRTLVSHTKLVRSLQLDSQSKKMVSGSYDGSLKIWGLENGALIKSLNQVTIGSIFSLQFDYGRIVCCSNQGKILVYDFTYDIDTQFFT
ncbi:hypothetical protein CU098_009704, partial [Rhizopus stolonifer]